MWEPIVRHHLDVGAFAALSAVALAITAVVVRRRGVRIGRRTWGLLLVLVACGCWTAERAGDGERARLRAQVEGLAPTYASELTLRGHGQVRLDAPADDPAYLALIETQKRWLQLNPQVNDVYTMRRRADGQIVLVVDSETDYDRDGRIRGEREQRTRIGEPYHTPSDALTRALAGEATFEDAPMTDRWGTWVSAFVPMRDAAGNVDGVLGIDYDARAWVAAIARARGLAIGAFGIPVAALVCSAGLMSLMRAEVRRRAASEDALRVSESEMAYRATHDRLTGLRNRAAFHQALADLLARRGGVANPAAGPGFAVMFLDFDRFKLINDSLGHDVGDLLLCGIARRLGEVTAEFGARSAGSVLTGRLGGDEFGVLLECREPAIAAVALAERLIDVTGRPYLLNGHEVITAASIGITTSVHAEHPRADEVVRDADTAMYKAKAAGGGRWVMFDVAMRAEMLERLTLEAELRGAIERGELVLHYQPIVSLESGRPCAFEALVRWPHPRRGLVMPAAFIALAEETGLIVPLGAWVIREACRQLGAWQRQFPTLAHFGVSVNISPKHLTLPELTQTVRQSLIESRVTPGTLAIEVTEGSVMRDRDAAVRVLGQLRELHVRSFLDDFGTGYSSLSCLHQFPVDVLKIDRSFVANTAERRDYAAVVSAVVALAHNVGVQLVAEGVETKDQVTMLQALGCDMAQGYHFATPLTVEAAEAYLAREARLAGAGPLAA